VEGNAEAPTEIGHEAGIVIGLGSEPVVDVDGAEREAKGRTEGAQHIEERGGVGAAGHCHQEGLSLLEQPVPVNREEDAVG
jgi:hypothetical protein